MVLRKVILTSLIKYMDPLGVVRLNQCETQTTKECYVDTLIGQLKRKQQRASADLAAANEALEALEKNPEIAKVLELLLKTR